MLAQHNQLWMAVITYLFGKGVITDEEANSEKVPAAAISLVDHFCADTGLEFNTPDDLAALQIWIKRLHLDSFETNNLVLSRTYTVAGQPVGLSLSYPFAIKDSEHRRTALLWLNQEIGKLYADIVNAEPQNSTRQLPETIKGGDKLMLNGVLEKRIDITGISKSYEGSARVRVHGGEYRKFGVPLYPEAPISPELRESIHLMPNGAYAASGVMVVEFKSDGKPKRVNAMLDVVIQKPDTSNQPSW